MGKRLAYGLLATDAAGSSVPCVDPFGYPSHGIEFFKSTRAESVKGHYDLGAGRRVYSSTLKRFLQPDRLSPFMPGELNSYTYCLNDPINREDPSGQWSLFSYIRRATDFSFMASKKASPVVGGERGVNMLIARENQILSATLFGNSRRYEDPAIAKSVLTNENMKKYFSSAISSDSPYFLKEIGQNVGYIFVMSKEGKMFVQPKTTALPFHPGIARNYAKGKSIIAAGELLKKSDFDFTLSHNALYYNTDDLDLVHPMMLLASRGARVTTVDKLPGLSWLAS